MILYNSAKDISTLYCHKTWSISNKFIQSSQFIWITCPTTQVCHVHMFWKVGWIWKAFLGLRRQMSEYCNQNMSCLGTNTFIVIMKTICLCFFYPLLTVSIGNRGTVIRNDKHYWTIQTMRRKQIAEVLLNRKLCTVVKPFFTFLFMFSRSFIFLSLLPFLHPFLF